MLRMFGCHPLFGWYFGPHPIDGLCGHNKSFCAASMGMDRIGRGGIEVVREEGIHQGQKDSIAIVLPILIHLPNLAALSGIHSIGNHFCASKITDLSLPQ